MESRELSEIRDVTKGTLLHCDGIIPVYLMASKKLLDVGRGEIATPSEG
jgi:hypothetical protein